LLVLWLPILMLVAMAIGLVIALAWWMRRRVLAQGQRGLITLWPGTAALLLVLIILLGTAPALTWFVGRQIFKPGSRAGAVQHLVSMHDCRSLRIDDMARFIATQPEALGHELEGLVLRATWHCVAPTAGAITPDASMSLAVGDRFHLRRMVAMHITRPVPTHAPISSQTYQEDWTPDAEGVMGMLVWQERGLTSFDQMLADTTLPPPERTTYLGLAAAHCLQQPADRRCLTLFDEAHLAMLVRTDGWPNYWDAKLQAALQVAIQGGAAPRSFAGTRANTALSPGFSKKPTRRVKFWMKGSTRSQ
jgi:hypothetical protein